MGFSHPLSLDTGIRLRALSAENAGTNVVALPSCTPLERMRLRTYDNVGTRGLGTIANFDTASNRGLASM